MSITEESILTRVNNNLRRAETDISTELISALKRISDSGDYLFGIDTQSVISGDNTLSFPENCKNIQYIRLTSLDEDPSGGNEDNKKERLIKIGFSEYLNKIGNSDVVSLPTDYAIYNDIIYLYPIPNENYTANIYYSKYHDYSTIIEFNEEFRTTIEAVTTLNVALKFGLVESVNLWADVALGLVMSHKKIEKQNIKITRFTRL